MTLKRVVFDFDNTLVPTMSGRRALFLSALRVWNSELTEEELEANWSASFEDVVRVCAPLAPYPSFLSSYEVILRSNPMEPLPCASALLRELRARGVENMIFTATSKRLALVDLETSGLLVYISGVIAAEDVRHPKPDLRSAKDLAESLRIAGSEPSDAVYIGDSTDDARIANACGIRFFAVTTGRNDANDFLAFGTPIENICRSLCEIASKLRIPLAERTK